MLAFSTPCPKSLPSGYMYHHACSSCSCTAAHQNLDDGNPNHPSFGAAVKWLTSAFEASSSLCPSLANVFRSGSALSEALPLSCWREPSAAMTTNLWGEGRVATSRAALPLDVWKQSLASLWPDSMPDAHPAFHPASDQNIREVDWHSQLPTSDRPVSKHPAVHACMKHTIEQECSFLPFLCPKTTLSICRIRLLLHVFVA